MPRPHTWFSPEATEKVREKLNAAGPGARLEIHGHWHEQTIYVVRPGEVLAEGSGGGVNEAHVCPPICPS